MLSSCCLNDFSNERFYPHHLERITLLLPEHKRLMAAAFVVVVV
jgi:hypothetical protein